MSICNKGFYYLLAASCIVPFSVPQVSLASDPAPAEETRSEFQSYWNPYAYDPVVSANDVGYYQIKTEYYPIFPDWHANLSGMEYDEEGNPLPDDGVSPNILLARIYVPPEEGSGETEGTYEFYAVETRDKTVQSDLSEYLSQIGWAPAFNKKAYELIHAGDTAGLQKLMSRYLPQFYKGRIPPEELERVNELLEEISYGGNTINTAENCFTAYYKAHPEAFTGLEAVIPLEDGGGSFISDTKPRKTYEQISLGNGQQWAPMDRAVLNNPLPPYSDQTEYLINKYWRVRDGEAHPGTAETENYEGSDTGGDFSEILSLKYKAEPLREGALTCITVGDLATQQDSVINLSWANTNPLTGDTGFMNHVVNTVAVRPFSYTDSDGDPQTLNVSVVRYLQVDRARLGEGTVFRVGGYQGCEEREDGTKYRRFLKGDFDNVYIREAEPANSTGTAPTKLYIQLGYVPGLEKGNSFGGVYMGKEQGFYNKPYIREGRDLDMVGYAPLLSILRGGEKFTVAGQEARADGVFNVYTIKPEVDKVENVLLTKDGKYEGTLWYLTGYTFRNTGEVAESGKAAGDNALAAQNLWRGFADHAFRRPMDFHDRYLLTPPQKAALRENTWAETWHGKFRSAGDYGRTVGQSYNGMMAGYDKMLNDDYGNGKVYTGVYVARMEGSSHTPSAGKGDQKGEGVGVYGSWVGDKGHYIDAEVSAMKLKNKYHFYGNNGKGLQSNIFTEAIHSEGDTTGNGTYGTVSAQFNTWAYGAGLRYGKRTDRGSVSIDPHVSMYAGHMDDVEYKLSNLLGVINHPWNSLVGKAGLQVGKKLAKGKGRLYAGVDVAHEFGKKEKVEQCIVARTSSGETSPVTARQLAAEQGGRDTWVELKAGGDVKLSDVTRFHVDYERTLGRKAGNDWNIAGRIEVAWDGLGRKGAKPIKASAPTDETGVPADGLLPSSEASVAAEGFSPVEGTPGVPTGEKKTLHSVSEQQASDKASVSPAEQAKTPLAETDAALLSKPGGNSDTETVNQKNNPTIYQGKENLSEFMLRVITVEAARPQWERKLSPGQVTVIDPQDFEGEQKDIPALLERVPGLFVDRQNGQGHYTTARIRGSTAAQVEVYIDGVRTNLSGDAAVNLSAIPAENVARIEVYRGYVPARFAGASMGGVINIVTKKPDKGHGRVSQGLRSYGGKTTTLEYSAPLGSGSLLATFNRDLWEGDFPVRCRTSKSNRPPFVFLEGRRRSNAYRNTDGMLKWQDDHWTVKGQFKHNHEELASNVSYFSAADAFWTRGYMDKQMELDYKELYVGREDTWGDLNLNWHIAYTDSDKKYRNVGLLRALAEPKWPPYDDIPDSYNPQSSMSSTFPGAQWADYHSKKWDFNVNLSYNLWDSHLLEFNANVIKEKMNTDGNNWTDKRDTPWIVFMQPQGMLNRYHNTEYHLTLQDTMSLNNAGDMKFTVIGRADKVKMDGLRDDWADNDARWRYSGGVALQKQFDDHWGLKSTWGTYYRHPNFYEIFGDGFFITQSYFQKWLKTMGYERGSWEWGHQFDFSLSHQGKMAGADTDTVLTWFQRTSNNQLVLFTPVRAQGESYYVPSGNISLHGIELSHHMKWNRLNFALTGTWQKGRGGVDLEGASVSSITRGNSHFVPNWVIDSRIDYTFPGDKLSIFGEYQYHGREVVWGRSSSPTPEQGPKFKEAYSLFNIGAHYKFNKALRLSLGVNDVFNKGYKVLCNEWGSFGMYKYELDYPMPGRTYYGTLEYRF